MGRERLVSLYDHDGRLVGKLCLETGRAQIGHLFYAPERTCRIVWNETDKTWECDSCGGAVGLKEVSYCESCGAKVFE